MLACAGEGGRQLTGRLDFVMEGVKSSDPAVWVFVQGEVSTCRGLSACRDGGGFHCYYLYVYSTGKLTLEGLLGRKAELAECRRKPS